MTFPFPLPGAVMTKSLGPALTYSSLTQQFPFSSQQSTPYSFPSCDIGAPDPKRIVAVAVNWRSTGSGVAPGSITIGGVPMAVAAFQSTSISIEAAIYWALVASGTTGDIVCSPAGGDTWMYCAIKLWRIIPGNVASPVVAQGNVVTSSATTLTVNNVPIKQNGCALVAVTGGANDQTYTASWSGTDVPIEREDSVLTASGAYAEYDFPTTVNDNTLDLTVNRTGGIGRYCIAIASFR